MILQQPLALLKLAGELKMIVMIALVTGDVN
jgi:hypothetical protein